MPELPEVEHVVRALRRVVIGRRIVAAEVTLPKLISPTTPSAFNRKLKGSHITEVNRRGKFILIHVEKSGALPDGPAKAPTLTSDLVLAVHLRMTGKFLYLSADDALPKHARAILYLDNDRRLVFSDQRKFGVMKLVARTRLAKTQGISELAPE